MPSLKQLLTTVGIGVGTVPILSYAFISYREWLKLGPGGVPYNFFGWLINASLHIVARSDTRVPAPYDAEKVAALYGPAANKSFFTGKALPPRSDSRPTVPTTVAPQRQMTEQATPEMLEKMKYFLAALAGLNPETTQQKPSGLEGPGHEALYLADEFPFPEHIKTTKGEFVHVHGEGSSHVTLSLADSAKVIELGWGERHKLSGVRNKMWGYVMIYAPRNENEFRVWKNIVVASAGFVTAAGPAIRTSR